MFYQCAHEHEKQKKGGNVNELRLKQTVYVLVLELILENQEEWKARWNEPTKE